MRKLNKKRKIAKLSLLTLGVLSAGLITTSVVACGTSNHDVVGKDTLRMFNPNAIESPANDGRSFDSSYSTTSLSLQMGPTKVNAIDSSTYGSYSFEFNKTDPSEHTTTEKPKSVAADTGIVLGQNGGKTIADNEHFLKTDTVSDGVKGFNQYQNAGLTVYSFDLRRGFGYTNLFGTQPIGYMPKDFFNKNSSNESWNANQKLEVTKWDFLLNYLRFWMAGNPDDYPNEAPFDKEPVVAESGYYNDMLGLEINSTVKINLDNSNPYRMYVVTNHVSPAEGILSKEFYTAPVSAGYLQVLLSKSSEFADLGFNTNLQNFLNENYSNYVPKINDDKAMPEIVKKYIAATTTIYGKDPQGDYDTFNILFSGKYYISKYKEYQYAVFKLNPYYNQNPITPNGRYHVLVENDKYVGGDSKLFGTIDEILSNQNSAIDPTEKAYQLWKDGQIDTVSSKMINANSANDVINNYIDYAVPVGTTPTSKTANISFNMSVWDSKGDLKSNISSSYAKFAKQFFSPAAIDLRYNLMRSVNYAGVATTINRINPSSINLSTAPINWGANFKIPANQSYPDVQKGESLDLPQYQDFNHLSMGGGLPIAQMQENPTDGFTSQQYISNEKLNWTWGDMQKSVTNDLKVLGLYDSGLHMSVLTRSPYSKEQESVFDSYYNQAWKAVSNNEVSLKLVPYSFETQKDVYDEQNAEIGSNYWSPDFSNGYGSWFRTFTSHNNFLNPDTIYGLAKQGLLTAEPKSQAVGIRSNPSIIGINSKNRFGFSDLGQYFLKNWNIVKGVNAPKNLTDLQKFLLLLFQGNDSANGQINSALFSEGSYDLTSILENNGLSYMINKTTKTINSGNLSGHLGDLLSFWVNQVGSGNDSPNQKALRVSSWMNIMSFLIPFPDATGYATEGQALEAKGLKLEISQTLDAVPDFSDIYLKSF